MSLQRVQSGFLLPAMLPILLLLATAFSPHGFVSSFPGERAAFRLAHMADTLRAYAAQYPDLYHPRGAGPGHLPCPDTDALAPGAQQNGLAEGPNPPCAHGALLAGWLPRHIQFPAGRHGFHEEPHRRIVYVVDGALINNPLDRPVSATHPTKRSGQETVVWLLWPRDAASTRERLYNLQRDLERLSERSGASIRWQRERERWLREGAVLRTLTLASVQNEAVRWTRAFVQSRIDGWLRAGCDWPEQWSGSSLAEQAGRLSWLDTASASASASACSGLDSLTLEGVPRSSHWLVRNGWDQELILRRHGAHLVVVVRR